MSVAATAVLRIIPSRRAARRVEAAGRSETGKVFLLSLVFFLAMVGMTVFRLNIFVTDAMSRTVHAWQVFFSAEPKLTAMGFIWPPLPTILQLPLVLLAPLRALGLSGNLVTAFMAAGTAALLWKLTGHLELPRHFRLGTLVLFCLNPMVLFYGSNGMSEMTFIFFTVASVYQLIVWRTTHGLAALMVSGLALGLALLSRYDTGIHALLTFAAVWFLAQDIRPRRSGRGLALALGIVAPVVFAGGLWILLNALIMGDPLHFARGDYSNAAQVPYQMALLSSISKLSGNPVGIIAFIAEQVTVLFPAFTLGLIVVVVDYAKRRDRLSLVVAVLALSFPAFQGLNFLFGQSAAFLRYFILAIPYGFFLLALALARVDPWSRGRLASLALAALALSNVSTAYAMSRATEWGQWNDIYLRALMTQTPENTWKDEREIAQLLMANTSGREALLDDFQGYRVIFFSGEPRRFIANADRDFAEAVNRPQAHARWALVSSTRLEGVLNAINRRYPMLYEQGAPWAELVREWPDVGWRLYRIKEVERAAG